MGESRPAAVDVALWSLIGRSSLLDSGMIANANPGVNGYCVHRKRERFRQYLNTAVCCEHHSVPLHLLPRV